MAVFKDYSKYYNLLYKDKNYNSEVDYLINLIKAHSLESNSILNLGCGTGNHDFIFASKGFHVTGVDLSQDMIDVANSKKSNDSNLVFLKGDVRDVRLDKTFDVVMSLFHVMSYQTSNLDLENAIKTAHAHLEKGGLFIFDCWYGPGVLTDRPTVRNKQFEDNNFLVTRLSTPHMYSNENCVDVEFNVTIKDKTNGQTYDIHEMHKMRYLFLPEVHYFLDKNGFELVLNEEWLSSAQLTYNSWNATFVAKKK